MSLARVPTIAEAVAAATGLAGEMGLVCDQPQVLHASGNVWVHLAPHPVVAQVPKDVLAVRGAGAITHLRRDVQVCGWLAARGVAVGAPSHILDPGPHEHNHTVVAFYRHYQRGSVQDDTAAGRALREMHDALADYKGPLAEMETPLHETRRVLGMLQAGRVLAPEQINRMRTRLESCWRHMQAWPTQPVHGDVHLQNVAWTSDGPLWTDFEDTCRAPLLWDLACLVCSTQLYGIPAARLHAALRGYGAELTARELKPFVHARVVQVTAWAATRSGHDQRAATRLRDGLHWLRHHQL